jgi:hypothetical protein
MPVLDDTTLRRYLLGELPETEMEALEHEYFTDPDVLSRVRGIEDDLIDDYAAGVLSPHAREAFERNRLATPAQRERVLAARALRLLATEPGTAEARRPATGIRFWPAFGALAAILLLSFVATRWRRPNVLISDKPAPSVARAESPIPAPPTPSAVDTPRPTHATFVLALAPLLTRGPGEPPQVRLPPRVAEVIIEFQGEPGALAADARARLSASLATVEGHSVWAGRAQVRTRAARADLLASARVPASVLKPDDYIATLKTEGRGEGADSFRYFFRIVE